MLLSVGYDSDDECEEDVRYTRRNKGKKYAALQNDDSLDQAPAYRGNHAGFGGKPNGQPKSFSGNGNLANRAHPLHEISDRDHHIHATDASNYSSEESSDIDAIVNSYSRPPNPGIYMHLTGLT